MEPCPTCGAKVGEFCVTKTGRQVLKDVGVHSARFKIKKSVRADHYAAI